MMGQTRFMRKVCKSAAQCKGQKSKKELSKKILNGRWLSSLLIAPSLFQQSLPKEPLGRHSHPARVRSFRAKLQQQKLEVKLHPGLYASLPTLAKGLVMWHLGKVEASLHFGRTQSLSPHEKTDQKKP